MGTADVTRQAQEVISAIAADLDEDLIRRRFDDPVDAVVRGLRYRADGPVTSETFHRVISDLLSRI